MLKSEGPGVERKTNEIRVFVSYDREHDGDLYDLLVEQTSTGTSGFEISARSEAQSATDYWDEGLRRAIREVDEVVAICGECSDGSSRMGAELRIAQEENRPYVLLWGRREAMCTKPSTAKPADTMYSWTREILRNQILTLRRLAESDERAAERSRAKAAASRAPSPPQDPTP